MFRSPKWDPQYPGMHMSHEWRFFIHDPIVSLLHRNVLAFTKHLEGGFILRWQADLEGKNVTLSLQSPRGAAGWIGLGISSNGMMTNANVVVGWGKGSKTKVSVSTT